MSPFQSISYLLQMALGLDALHENGCIHNDIKPQNLVLKGTGQLKICDFGFAKFMSDERLTSQDRRVTRGLVGTPQFMSPEMLNIENKPGYGIAADVYAMGHTLYEIVTGQRGPYYAPLENLKELHKTRIECTQNIDKTDHECKCQLGQCWAWVSLEKWLDTGIVKERYVQYIHENELTPEWITDECEITVDRSKLKRNLTSNGTNMEILINLLMHPIEEKRLTLDELWSTDVPRHPEWSAVSEWMNDVIAQEFKDRAGTPRGEGVSHIVDRKMFREELLKPTPSPNVFCDETTYTNVQKVVDANIEKLK